MIKGPAPAPCGSCPYRQDVPSGVWAEEEYAKLPDYDNDTPEQPLGVFCCHQQDGRVCAGWVATHDMRENLAIRVARLCGHIDAEALEAICTYETKVPVFASGAEAAEHGRERIVFPDEKARKLVAKLEKKLS